MMKQSGIYLNLITCIFALFAERILREKVLVIMMSKTIHCKNRKNEPFSSQNPEIR